MSRANQPSHDGFFNPVPDNERGRYEAALIEWRQLRAKPHESKTAEDYKRLKELFNYVSQYGIGV